MDSSALQDRRVWLVGGAAAAVLIVAVSWLFVINPKMAAGNDLQSQSADNDLQNSTLQKNIDDLAEQDTHIDALRQKLRTALLQLPSSSRLPEFTRKVTAAATRSSVTLSSITIGAQSPVLAAAAPVVATPADGSTATDSTSTDTGASETTTTDSSTDPIAVAGTPAAAAQYLIPVTLSTTGAVADQIAFVHALQHGTRSVLVTSTQLTDSTTSTMTVQLDMFTAPVDAAQRQQLAALLHAGN